MELDAPCAAWDDLVPDMKREVRARLGPLSALMLALTCRAEATARGTAGWTSTDALEARREAIQVRYAKVDDHLREQRELAYKMRTPFSYFGGSGHSPIGCALAPWPDDLWCNPVGARHITALAATTPGYEVVTEHVLRDWAALPLCLPHDFALAELLIEHDDPWSLAALLAQQLVLDPETRRVTQFPSLERTRYLESAQMRLRLVYYNWDACIRFAAEHHAPRVLDLLVDPASVPCADGQAPEDAAARCLYDVALPRALNTAPRADRADVAVHLLARPLPRLFHYYGKHGYMSSWILDAVCAGREARCAALMAHWTTRAWTPKLSPVLNRVIARGWLHMVTPLYLQARASLGGRAVIDRAAMVEAYPVLAEQGFLADRIRPGGRLPMVEVLLCNPAPDAETLPLIDAVCDTYGGRELLRVVTRTERWTTLTTLLANVAQDHVWDNSTASLANPAAYRVQRLTPARLAWLMGTVEAAGAALRAPEHWRELRAGVKALWQRLVRLPWGAPVSEGVIETLGALWHVSGDPFIVPGAGLAHLWDRVPTDQPWDCWLQLHARLFGQSTAHQRRVWDAVEARFQKLGTPELAVWLAEHPRPPSPYEEDQPRHDNNKDTTVSTETIIF